MKSVELKVGQQSNLETYFERFRENTIGVGQTFTSPYGEQEILYADWTASGRLYRPIEEKISSFFGPFVGNTHTEATETGGTMTRAYAQALKIIKEHVNADARDVAISSGSGMTGVINKFQRMMGFRIHEKWKDQIEIPQSERPVVFITHMEHHSNHTSWSPRRLKMIASCSCSRLSIFSTPISSLSLKAKAALIV
jgi:selenocysteine lyase/cysteine desulfurase